jgi:hypothetical protein
MGSALSDTTYAIIYDLHSHTQASDGLLTPKPWSIVPLKCASARWR